MFELSMVTERPVMEMGTGHLRQLAAVAVAWAVCCAGAWGQRMVFPTSQSQFPATTQPRIDPGVQVPPARLDGSIQQLPQQGFDPYAMPSSPVSPLGPPNTPRTLPGAAVPYGNNPYTPPAGVASPYTNAPAYNGVPYNSTPYNAAPGAAPYNAAPPYGAAPYAQPPAGGYLGQPAYPGYHNGVLVPRPQRLTRMHFDYAFMSGKSGNDLDINDFNLRGSFLYDFLYAQQPLVLTPGFGLHLWGGPATRDLPGQVFDFSVDIGWRPQLGERFSVDLGISPGMYTDFDGVDSEAFRLPGRAIGLLTLSQAWEMRFGVVYLDRAPVKLLPVLGLVWTPNDETRFELVFPRPKLAQKLVTNGSVDWWWYVSAEYGGNTWLIHPGSGPERVDYEDIKLTLGLEWQTSSNGPQGFFEIGYVFQRELEFSLTTPPLELDDTIMFRTGVSF